MGDWNAISLPLKRAVGIAELVYFWPYEKIICHIDAYNFPDREAGRSAGGGAGFAGFGATGCGSRGGGGSPGGDPGARPRGASYGLEQLQLFWVRRP